MSVRPLPCLRPDQPERGATAAEYALLASLIAVAVAVIVGTLGTQVAGLFQATVDGFL